MKRWKPASAFNAGDAVLTIFSNSAGSKALSLRPIRFPGVILSKLFKIYSLVILVILLEASMYWSRKAFIFASSERSSFLASFSNSAILVLNGFTAC